MTRPGRGRSTRSRSGLRHVHVVLADAGVAGEEDSRRTPRAEQNLASSHLDAPRPPEPVSDAAGSAGRPQGSRTTGFTEDCWPLVWRPQGSPVRQPSRRTRRAYAEAEPRRVRPPYPGLAGSDPRTPTSTAGPWAVRATLVVAPSGSYQIKVPPSFATLAWHRTPLCIARRF